MRKPQAVLPTALRPFAVGANAFRRGYGRHEPRYVSHSPTRRWDGDVSWSAPVNEPSGLLSLAADKTGASR